MKKGKRLTSVSDEYEARERLRKTTPTVKNSLTVQEARKWVGLTDAEAAYCWSTTAVITWQHIEAKLKEKNSG